jgi:hypothetical protein
MDKGVCKECNILLKDVRSLELHRWEYHPKNEMESYWSQLKKSGKLYSGHYTLGYQDDPYY